MKINVHVRFGDRYTHVLPRRLYAWAMGRERERDRQTETARYSLCIVVRTHI